MRLSAACLLAFTLSGCGGNGDHLEPPVNFTASGTVSYSDRLYTRLTTGDYGFSSGQDKPVRFATVQVLDASGAVVAEAGTDDLGRYTVAAAGGDQEPMRLRVLARTRSGVSVTVKDLAGNVLAVSTGFAPGSLTTKLDLAVSGDLAGAFNMLDVYTAAGEFMQEMHGRPPPALTAHWQPGGTPPGGTSYFCATCPAAIYVLGGAYAGDALAGDSDHFDDDVLLHEYGHFVEHSIGILHSPGGYHTLNDARQDLRLAWSEGFSSFLGGAIKAWMAERRHVTLSSTDLPHSFYLDTEDDIAGGGRGLYFDFAALPLSLRHATNESAVAKVLWNLHDGAPGGMADIWEAFAANMPAVCALHPASLETFWDGWQASELIASPADEALAAFAERDVQYAPDTYEVDDVTGARDTDFVGLERHNLYKHAGAPEIDVIPFQAVVGTGYRIETYALANGADTYLRILDASGTPLAENDDAAPPPANTNSGCALASRIDTFVPAATGRYYAEVTRSPVPRPWAGRYGGYELRITALPSGNDPVCP